MNQLQQRSLLQILIALIQIQSTKSVPPTKMQADQKQIKQKIKKLLVAMNNHDPDVAEMAAKDLFQQINAGKINLKSPDNKQLAMTITDNYLKQVGSPNFAVHSSAINFLANIVPHLAEAELIHIFKSTISSTIDPKIESNRVQVFSVSASKMITHAPGNLGSNLSTLFVQCVNQFLKLSSRKNSKQEEEAIIHLLTIIINFSEKWPDVVGNKEVKYDRQLLIQILLANIQTSRKLDLISKSDAALEKLAAVFDHGNFEFTFNHKQYGILPFIRKNQKANSEQQLKQLKYGIVCINHIVHAHNREMRPWVKQITRICVELVNTYKNNSEHLYLVTQIIENSIDCLTSLLKAYSSQLSEWIGTGKFAYLSNFIEETLNFDLEQMMNYLEDSSEMEQEYEEDDYYYAQNSVCWKVRQVSLAYVTMLMRKDMEFKEKKAKSIEFLNLLSTKLIEQDENVSKKAFECFNFIIESISTTKKDKENEDGMSLKRVKSNQGNFALTLVDMISSKIHILFNHKKTKQQSKTQAAKTLLNLIELLNDLIKDNLATCSKVLALIQELLPKVKPDSCVFLIKSSKTLINGSLPYEKIVPIIDVYLKMAKSNNFKVLAASFDGLRNVMKHYHKDLIKSGKINEILAILLPKFKEHDADKLVKIQAIRCLGPIFQNIFTQLPENQQNQILSAAEIKLKVQIDKSTINNQIPSIPDGYVIKKSQQQIFKNMLDLCSQSLGTSNYQLSNLAVQCCDKLIRLQQSTITEKNTEIILNKCRPMLSEGKVCKFMNILMQKYPKTFQPYADAIVKTAQSQYIQKMIEKKIITPENTIVILKNMCTGENYKKLSIILSKIYTSKEKLLSEINETKWGLVCLGALGYIGDLSTIDQIHKIILNSQNHDFKFEGARAIGNIASRHPEYAFKLIELSKQPNQSYIYLQALKEMLTFRTTELKDIDKIIHFLFAKAEENDRETNKHLLAECIGHIAKISSVELKRILDSVQDMNTARRYLVASSLRYALQGSKKQQLLDQALQQYIQKVFELTKDKDVTVREGALKSMNSIIDVYEETIRSMIDKQFMDQLLDSMTIKPELIKVIDYGVSKEKKDMGKGLRIQAFNFVKAILGMRQVEGFFQPIICKCLQKITQQSSNDLILKRVHIIRLISTKDPTTFLPYQNDFAVKIGTTEGVLKAYAGANSGDDERSQGYLKSLFKEIVGISKGMKEGAEVTRAMVNKIKTFDRLNRLIEGVERDQ